MAPCHKKSAVLPGTPLEAWATAGLPAAEVPNEMQRMALRMFTDKAGRAIKRWLVRACSGGQRAGSCRRSTAISRECTYCRLESQDPFLINATARGDRLLYWRASSVSEHFGLLRECRPPAQCELNVCRDNRARYETAWSLRLRNTTRMLTTFPDVREVDRDTLEPILFLLQSADIEVQRAASAALGNLAVNSEQTKGLHKKHKLTTKQPRTKFRLFFLEGCHPLYGR